MRNILAKTSLAAFIALGSLTFTAPAALADSFGFSFGPQGGFEVEVGGHDRDWRRPHRGFDDRPGWDRHERRAGCSPRLAIAKARDFGLRRADVTDVSRRRVVVEGRTRGGYERVVFANVRGCPVINF